MLNTPNVIIDEQLPRQSSKQLVRKKLKFF